MRSGWGRFVISLMRRTPEAVKALADQLRTALVEINRSLALPGDPSKDEQGLLARVEQRQALLLQELLNSELGGTRLINIQLRPPSRQLTLGYSS
jgi:hypothetical protein